MGKENETIWVRLRRAFKRMVMFPQRGDGGAYTDKYLPITKQQADSSIVVKDSTVVSRTFK